MEKNSKNEQLPEGKGFIYNMVGWLAQNRTTVYIFRQCTNKIIISYIICYIIYTSIISISINNRGIFNLYSSQKRVEVNYKV